MIFDLLLKKPNCFLNSFCALLFGDNSVFIRKYCRSIKHGFPNLTEYKEYNVKDDLNQCYNLSPESLSQSEMFYMFPLISVLFPPQEKKKGIYQHLFRPTLIKYIFFKVEMSRVDLIHIFHVLYIN